MGLLEKLRILDYYGQRPWRQGHQSIEPPDIVKEREGMASLLELEKSEDHSVGNIVVSTKKYTNNSLLFYLEIDNTPSKQCCRSIQEI